MTVLAHRIQVAQGSAEIELLIAAGVFIAGSAFLFWRAGRSWASFGTFTLGLAALVAAFVVPPTTSSPPVAPSSDPLVSIIKPESGARLPAEEEVVVTVVLENAPLDDGGTLELLVDGRKRGAATSPRFRVRLGGGKHRLTVRYVPAAGSPIRPIETSVLVTAG